MTNGKAATRFTLSTVIWGEDYVRAFLEVSALALLAPGNLPALASRYPVRYHIQTDPEGERLLAASPVIRRIADIVPLDIEASIRPEAETALPNEETIDKFPVWSMALNRTLDKAIPDRSWVILWGPDSLFADNSLAHVAELVEKGAKAVCVGGSLIVDRAAMLAAIAPYRTEGEASPLSIPPRVLARLAFDHRHPGFRCHDYDSDGFTHWPCFINFPIPGEGMLVRNFHTSPIAFQMVRPLHILPKDTVDLLFLSLLLKGGEPVAYVNNTDDICVANMAGPNEGRKIIPGRPRPDILGKFVKHWTTPLHRKHARIPYFWHFGEMTHEKWAPAIRASEQFLNLMLASGEAMKHLRTNP
jgi:hypothetical protein